MTTLFTCSHPRQRGGGPHPVNPVQPVLANPGVRSTVRRTSSPVPQASSLPTASRVESGDHDRVPALNIPEGSKAGSRWEAQRAHRSNPPSDSNRTPEGCAGPTPAANSPAVPQASLPAGGEGFQPRPSEPNPAMRPPPAPPVECGGKDGPAVRDTALPSAITIAAPSLAHRGSMRRTAPSHPVNPVHPVLPNPAVRSTVRRPANRLARHGGVCGWSVHPARFGAREASISANSSK